MKLLKTAFLILIAIYFVGCLPNVDPKGATYKSNSPFYITKKPEIVKHILVPAGTKLVYQATAGLEGEQDKMMDEENLYEIKVENGGTIDWAGIPVNWIYKFFNEDMSGFRIYPDFEKMKKENTGKFAKMWYECADGMGITVKSTADWSANLNNISDVESCGVNYQRFFKDDKKMQNYLDSLFSELKKSAVLKIAR
ncbi:MAG: hypothetical protein EOO87_12875 [Pedobacter sp.]|nr:MAG: hypothetical protein EOO87_12875 [Pedobacter sp.]